LVAECQRLGIPFRDCNKSFGKDLDRPLFIDPLHLTDQGNEEVVKIIDNVLTSGEK
jgi:lysophospholipase L1-like esterase